MRTPAVALQCNLGLALCVLWGQWYNLQGLCVTCCCHELLYHQHSELVFDLSHSTEQVFH